MAARGRSGLRHRSAVVALVATSLAAVLAGASPSAAAPQAPSSDPPPSARSMAADIGVDPLDPAAVAQAWQALLAAPGDQGLTNGSTANCTPGTTSQSYRTTELNALNAMRKLAGVNPVTESQSLSAEAQKAALLVAANNQLNHSPPSSWACWTTAGSAATNTSNLAQGASGSGAMRGYLWEPGASNYFAGHRRYLLCGSMAQTGFGDFGSWNAMKVVGVPSTTWASRDGFVAWPYPGIVPVAEATQNHLLDLFSFQLPPNHTASSPTVSITSSSGGTVTADVETVEDGYCNDAVTWGVSRPPADGQNWTITVGGLADAAGTAYRTTYTVKFTNAMAGIPGAPTNVSASGGNGQATVSWAAAPPNSGTVTGYAVIPSIGGTALDPVLFDSTSTTQTIPSLTNGQSYTFRVFARTATATGPLSAASGSVLVAGPPSTPARPTGVSGDGQATVSWTPPSNGGSAITGYTLTPYVGDDAQAPIAVTGTSRVVTGLTNGTAYTFRVAATNARGTSGRSAASEIVRPSVPLFAPFASWADFVTRQHLDLTEVAPSTTSRASWVSQLSNGTKTTGDLIEALRRGTDNVGNVDPVTRLYRAFLGRTPDASGLAFWVHRKRAGTWTVTRMADSFASSSEFKRTYGTLSNRAFVTRIYTDVLGRTADTGGVDFWTRKLDTKARTRGSVMVGFSESNEYRVQQAERTDVAIAYAFLLGRAPTAAEEATWVDRQEAGTTQAALATELLASSTYADRIDG